MENRPFKTFMDQQRQFFNTGKTLSIPFRIEQLKKLKVILQNHESQIAAALRKDLNKAPAEAILNEILLVNEEIDFIHQTLKKWARPKKASTPFPILWPGVQKFISNLMDAHWL